MARGELFEMFMQDTKKLTDAYKRNPSFKRFLVRLYLTAEAWSRQKGIRLEDVEIVQEEMSMDSSNATWKFIKSEGAQEKKKSGLLGADGLPIELSGHASS